MSHPIHTALVVVTSQDELDRVLNNPEVLYPEQPVVLKASDPEALRPTVFNVHTRLVNPIEVTNGTWVDVHVPDMDIEVRGGRMNTPHVQKSVHIVHGHAHVPRGCDVEADGGFVSVRGGPDKAAGTIRLRGAAQGEVDGGTVLAFDNSKIVAYGSTKVRATGLAQVTSHAVSDVYADDRATVYAHGKSTTRLYENATGYGNENSSITLTSPTARANMGPGSTLRTVSGVTSDHYEASEGVRFEEVSDLDARYPDIVRDLRLRGAAAFEDGKMRAPVLDAEVQKALEGLLVGDPRSVEMMEAYTEGFDGASQAQNPYGAELIAAYSGRGVPAYSPDTPLEPHLNSYTDDTETCCECGEPFTTDDTGITRHVGSGGGVDYDADEDHSPFAEFEDVVPQGFPLTEKVLVLPDHGFDPEESPMIPLPPVDGVRPEGTVIAKPTETLIKIGYKKGEPHVVQNFNWDTRKWGRSMSSTIGPGKALIAEATRTHPNSRKVPEHVAAAYGQCTGSCLMCSRPLSDAASMGKGYGPSCRSKLA
ncbi:MAG: hypothetical protein E6R04_06700 [Spirochaetes bacterium]|nr:MAG: hypothetical protein E6R04_06700 [Spirochaetota bacterium]